MKISGSVFDKHQIAIAKATLKMSDEGALIMGGMSKDEARKILQKHKIKVVKNPPKKYYQKKSKPGHSVCKGISYFPSSSVAKHYKYYTVGKPWYGVVNFWTGKGYSLDHKKAKKFKNFDVARATMFKIYDAMDYPHSVQGWVGSTDKDHYQVAATDEKRNPSVKKKNPIRKKWYVGYTGGFTQRVPHVYSYAGSPTRKSHGHLYVYSTGPYKTKEEAHQNMIFSVNK